jgi:hypothetical protein
MIPTAHLPLLEPLRAIPVVGNPIADLLEPDTRVLVNLGFGCPDQGWSTGPPNVPTSFGLFPHVNPGNVLADLATGAQQGVGAFTNDLANLSLPDLAQLPTVPTPTFPTSIGGFIQDLQTVNTNVTKAFSSALATGYSVLLPTADFLNAGLISIPAYDFNLFLNGIGQALNGDPVGGLIHAIGDPIAADVALFTIAGGFEAIVLASAAQSIVGDLASL